MSQKDANEDGTGLTEDRIRARLRELTDATRQVRHELEDLIKRPEAELTRGQARTPPIPGSNE